MSKRELLDRMQAANPGSVRSGGMLLAARDEPEIVVTETGAPIADSRFMATVGDYDLDCTVGTGPTPLAAIVDLLDQLEG